MATCVDCTISYTKEYQDRLIDKINTRITEREKFFSLEFFPPRTPSGTCNLYEKCSRLSRGQPLFCDVTCNVNKEERNESSNHFVKVASAAQDITQCDTVLQLNASQLTEDSADDLLQKAKNNGLSTVMVVSGNSKVCIHDDSEEFSCSADLVRFIRTHYANDFNICIAGYPSCLSRDKKRKEEIPYEQTFTHLLAEVKAGADFIITQMVFEASVFLDFVEKCKECGITVPIIPGILPIQSFGCIKQLRRYSKVKIPDKVMNILRPIQNNDAAVLKYGIYLTVQLCQILLKSVLCCGLHFFTLNREIATTEILKQVGLWHEPTIRRLPWGPQHSDIRHGEEIRPIFWACRKESYIYRTAEWEEFPNGRWGDSSMASFGTFRDYRLFYAEGDDVILEYKKMWGEELTSVEDVNGVFVSFLTGEKNKHDCKVTQIPWCDEELAPETRSLSTQLSEMNANGFLTINSQPNVNCLPSHDRIYGWGSPGGYVFQKAYLEFFCSEEDGDNMRELLKHYPMINYHFVNHSGTKNYTNTDSNSNAVTWGVFTGQLILQPTVVDPVAFQFWKDEAFELWLQQWGRLYKDKSKSHDVIQHIHDTYYLVNLVDNDYVKGNCLFDIINKVMFMRTPKDDLLSSSSIDDPKCDATDIAGSVLLTTEDNALGMTLAMADNDPLMMTNNRTLEMLANESSTEVMHNGVAMGMNSKKDSMSTRTPNDDDDDDDLSIKRTEYNKIV